ncbi:MAG: metal-sulfur cluster assembly factor [Gemmatimonadetes bacterium]|nr:MAG: metal-sulfur cluster assembly factor [Gemmatimonadota bacterium]
MAHITEAQIWEKLKEFYDPEIPINVVDLGLIYGVQVRGTQVSIKATLTVPACPLKGHMIDGIRRTILQLEGVDHVDVELIWTPPWSPALMTDEGKRRYQQLRDASHPNPIRIGRR